MRIRYIIAVSMIVMHLFASFQVARAADSILALNNGAEVLSVTQKDLDHDGQPDVTTIEAKFVTQHDRVTVYDGANDMRWSNNWSEATDFANDVWIFDVGADETAQLILRFSNEAGEHVAYLWDDADGNNSVSYSLDSRQVTISESESWILRVASRQPWMQEDGSFTPELTWSMFGCGNCDYIPAHVRNELTPYMHRAGTIDFAGALMDRDQDGVPDYFYTRLLTNIPLTYGIPRSNVNEVKPLRKVGSPKGYVFWPLLAGPRMEYGKHYFDKPPIVTVNWNAARIDGGVTLPGYPTENGYHINSLAGWKPDEINEAPFENPMAYYDLANDRDGDPELHIRVEYMLPQVSDPRLRRPIEDVRYSWNQTNTPGTSWDYRIGLAGLHRMDSVETYGAFGVRTIPYSDLPAWVTRNTWEWQTFVASQAAPYKGSEGIYDWSALDGLDDPTDYNRVIPGTLDRQRNYIAGLTDKPPTDIYNDIHSGLRGEVSVRPGFEPKLYISALDRQVHLLRADRGVWNIDGGQRVRYDNIDGGLYLNRWRLTQQRSVGEEFIRELITLDGQLLLHEGDSIIIKPAPINYALHEGPPPANNAEWRQFGDAISATRRTFAPGDFAAMLDALGGPSIKINGASLQAFRNTDIGFRFELQINEGFQVEGDAGSAAWIRGLTPGRYAVAYAPNSGYVADPLTAEMLEVSGLEVKGGILTALRPAAIAATVRNLGNGDVTAVPVRLSAGRHSDDMAAMGVVRVDVPANGSATVTFAWAPSDGGEWLLKAEANEQQVETVTKLAAMAPPTDIAVVVRTSGLDSIIAAGSTLALLLMVVGLSATCWLLLDRSYRSRPRDSDGR